MKNSFVAGGHQLSFPFPFLALLPLYQLCPRGIILTNQIPFHNIISNTEQEVNCSEKLQITISSIYKLKTAQTSLWRHYRPANSKIHVLIVSLRMKIFELSVRGGVMAVMVALVVMVVPSVMTDSDNIVKFRLIL